MLRKKKIKLLISIFFQGPRNKYDIVYLLSYYEEIMGNNHDPWNFRSQAWTILTHLCEQNADQS